MKRAAISPASPEQRAKVREALSIVSGLEGCDPAHLLPRSLGGCDDALCVVPLLRAEHRAYDTGELDLLPYLLKAGCYAEIAHCIEAHHISPLPLLERLTADKWAPAFGLMPVFSEDAA